MGAELNLTLAFDDNRWHTHIGDRHISAVQLAELESQITDIIRRMPRFAAHESVHVSLACDTCLLPDWLRQYHGHYFNSRLMVRMPVRP